MRRRQSLGLVAVLACGLLAAGAAGKVSEAEARNRLIKIIEQLEKTRFCQSGRCRYTDVRFQVSTTDRADRPFKGLIRAGIVRPSQTLDKARYQLEFIGGRWQLMGGTESTDVNEALYTGDKYEFTSAYGRTPVRGKLTDPTNDLETGYKRLYLKILDKGRER
ncbi:hypothetical protein [Gloeobacter morelensis]|uniref:Lipoprotein n=1 Tax=Gloeobacter morelensis MG652769 TaxID=2781736 RepID=A0ABY3PQ50_9CYAN|nr:hypothetical protein [Gloeobacter morelensis]UFP95769.1 hypothetical protein ISF26_05930 [Gloeobacter morelensis MG652769]